MAVVAATAPARHTAQPAQQAAAAPLTPFIRASSEHREPTGIDVTRQLTGSDQDLGVFDIPAIGYVRSLLILVQATGGAGTGVVAAEDGPFNVIKNISFGEPNGATLAQFSTGYNLYLVNKWGGYRNMLGADPKASPIYAAPAAVSGNFTFAVRVPVEINLRDALGSLPNQNAASTFKLRLSLAAAAQVFTTAPATLPSVRVRVFSEVWDQPEAASAGAANATTPPAVNTTQFWTEQVLNYNGGQQTLRLSRVGNYLRELIFIARRTASTRANGDADWPDPLTVYLDTRPIDIVERNNFKNQMYERSGYGRAGVANEAAAGLDNGVFVYDFAHEFSGLIGQENRDLYLETQDSTRLELQGNWGSAGSLTVLTNDVQADGPIFL